MSTATTQPAAVYSPQQIKWDLLSAIREFGTDAKGWTVMLSDDPPEETLARRGLDPVGFVFMGKPALSPRGAQLVHDFLTRRMGVPTASDASGGRWVMVYRPVTS